MKHTPTPWDVDGNERNLFVIAKTETLPTVARATGLTREEAEANARFIVRAVNSHEALLEAMRTAADQAHRASLVQDRSVGIIKQALALIASDLREAVALAEKES